MVVKSQNRLCNNRRMQQCVLFATIRDCDDGRSILHQESPTPLLKTEKMARTIMRAALSGKSPIGMNDRPPRKHLICADRFTPIIRQFAVDMTQLGRCRRENRPGVVTRCVIFFRKGTPAAEFRRRFDLRQWRFQVRRKSGGGCVGWFRAKCRCMIRQGKLR